MTEKHITIQHEHSLPFNDACELAEQWKQSGEAEYNMRCEYDSKLPHTIHFKRSGVEGTLTTTATHFNLTAHLGFLLRPYKERITAAIEKNVREHIDAISTK